MSDMQELYRLRDLLSGDTSSLDFTQILNEGISALGLNVPDAATAFDVGTNVITRWTRGVVVPPAKSLVLRFLLLEIQKKITAEQG